MEQIKQKSVPKDVGPNIQSQDVVSTSHIDLRQKEGTSNVTLTPHASFSHAVDAAQTREMETELALLEEQRIMNRKKMALEKETQLKRLELENEIQQRELELEMEVRQRELQIKMKQATARLQDYDAYSQDGDRGTFGNIEPLFASSVKDLPGVPAQGNDVINAKNRPGGPERFKVNNVCQTQTVPKSTQFANEGHGNQQMLYDQQRQYMSTLSLPPLKMSMFNGDICEYYSFMRTFDTIIASREPRCFNLLCYLESYTQGYAKDLVRCCQLINDPVEGYRKAREMLDRKYGEKYPIVSKALDELMKGPPIKSEDLIALEYLSVSITRCKIMIEAMGYTSRLSNPDSLYVIVERLPYDLRKEWRKKAAKYTYEFNKEITMTELEEFVWNKVREYSHPVFGRLTNGSKKSQAPERTTPNVKRSSYFTNFNPNIMNSGGTVEMSSTHSAPDGQHVGPYEMSRTQNAPAARHDAGSYEMSRTQYAPDAQHDAGPYEMSRIHNAPDAQHGAGPYEKSRIHNAPDAQHDAGPYEKSRTHNAPDAQHGAGPYEKSIGCYVTGARYVQSPKDYDTNDHYARPSMHSATDVNNAHPHAKLSTCLLCEGNHALADCTKFKELKQDERFNFVKERQLCFCCLGSNHGIAKCRKMKSCSINGCTRKHHVLLHRHQEKSSPLNDEVHKKHCGSVNLGYENDCSVAMAIVPVYVRHKGSSKSVLTYAFLDNGSNATFCTDALLRKLNVQGSCSKITLTTMNGSSVVESCEVLRLLEISDVNENEYFPLSEVFSRPSIPISRHDIPTERCIATWPHLSEIQITNIDSDVDLLISCNDPKLLQPLECISSKDGSPYATKTVLGWTLNGPLKRDMSSRKMFFVKMNEETLCNDLLEDTKNLKKEMSVKDVKFMDNAKNTITQHEDMHYEARLPLKNNEVSLPNNMSAAMRKADNLKMRFRKDEAYFESYSKQMNLVISQGYAYRIGSLKESNDKRAGGNEVWYVPGPHEERSNAIKELCLSDEMYPRQVNDKEIKSTTLFSTKCDELEESFLEQVMSKTLIWLKVQSCTAWFLWFTRNMQGYLQPLTLHWLRMLKDDYVMFFGVIDENYVYSRRRWKQIHYLSDILSKRSSKEYIILLQERNTCKRSSRNLKKNDVVLLVYSQRRMNEWLLGKVENVYQLSRCE